MDEHFPNPLRIDLGQGLFELHTFTSLGTTHVPGILIKHAGTTHTVGDVPPSRAGRHKPAPGEVYICIETIEAAVVLQDMLTATMRRLLHFPEYPETETP